ERGSVWQAGLERDEWRLDALRHLPGLAWKDGRTRGAGRRGQCDRSFLLASAEKLPEQIRPGLRRARYEIASRLLQRLLRSGRRRRRVELDAELFRRIPAAPRIRSSKIVASLIRKGFLRKECARSVRLPRDHLGSAARRVHSHMASMGRG